jgi:glycosyltransferase involved in cell wall biosynthesis
MVERGRILVVTSSFPRSPRDSTSPFVLHLAEDLQALGWRIDVLAPHTPGTATRESINGVSVERFRYFWPASAQTLCYEGGALLNLRRNRWNVIKVPVLVFLQSMGIARRLVSRRYDMVHSHWILPQAFTAALSAVLLRVPHVVTVHGSDVFSLRGRLLTQFKKVALNGASAVTVNSLATGAAVAEIVPRLREVHRIPMGASASRGRPAVVDALRQRFRRHSGPLLVFVGRVIEQKGVADLLRAVTILVPRLPGVTAIIVGDGQDRSTMVSLASELKIGDRVSFVGSVAPADVPDYLAAADLFVGPSKRGADGSSEGLGLTFIEAMLAGTPVVATRVGGIKETVQHEETGLLVSENAPREIADAVERLVTDRDLALRLSGTALELARNHFTREVVARSFSQLFEQMISLKA